MKKYSESAVTVPETNYTRAMYLSTLENLKRATEVQSLTGAGTVDLDKATCVMNAVTGAYVVTLPNGVDENEQQKLVFIGTGGTFEVRGTFYNFTKVIFDTNGRSADLWWSNGKWVLVGGTALPQ